MNRMKGESSVCVVCVCVCVCVCVSVRMWTFFFQFSTARNESLSTVENAMIQTCAPAEEGGRVGRKGEGIM